MKKFFCFCFASFITCSIVYGQEENAITSDWEFNPALNLYFFSDDFFVVPVVKADRNKLHLEARYNYEDRNTFSGWVGYNLVGGKSFEYAITPMLGGVIGNSNGIAPGIEGTFTYKRFEIYTESEFFVDLENNEDFVYTWTDFSYSIKDWLWFGISGQRTRLYDTEFDLQRGLLVGAGYKSIELTTYFYNPGSDDAFVLLGFEASF